MENRVNKALSRLEGIQLDKEWIRYSERNGLTKDLGGASQEISK